MSKHVAQINNENKIISRWAFSKYHNSKVTEKRIERYCCQQRKKLVGPLNCTRIYFLITYR